MKRIVLAVVLLALSSQSFAQQQALTSQQYQQLGRAGVAIVDRANITGAEAEVLLQVKNMLVGIANGQLTLIPSPPQAAPTPAQGK